VIITGPSRKPDSSTQVVPVISPLPLSDHQPAKTGLLIESFRAEARRSHPFERSLANLQFSFTGNERGVPDGDAGYVGYGVEWAGRAVKRNPRSRARGLAGGAA